MHSPKHNTVTLAVGAGSGATARFINDHILTRFGNATLNALEDASHVMLPSSQAVITTDSYSVDPPVFPGGNIGHMAIAGTVNDLLASGAKPLYLTFALVIGEGFPYPDLEQILDAASETALAAQVQIVAGDTKVMDRRTFDSIIINTTGLGTPVRPDTDYALARAQIGDRIITTGTVGDHGLAILSLREGLGFEQRVKSDCAPLHDLILPLLEPFDGIHSLRDLTRGGILNALHDLAEATQTSVRVNADSIPIQREVQMGCEMLGLNPLSLLNEGKMMLVVAPDQTDQVLATLRRHPLGQNSAVIGELMASNNPSGELLLRENSTLKVQVRPEGDAIPRLC